MRPSTHGGRALASGRAALLAACEVLAVWPTMPEALASGAWHHVPRGGRARARPEGGNGARHRARAAPTPHTMAWSRQLRCSICAHCGYRPKPGRRRMGKVTDCPGAGSAVSALLADAHHSHRLFLQEWNALDGVPDGLEAPLLFCAKCGAYSQTLVRQLALPCGGEPPTGTTQRTRWNRLRAGCHPREPLLQADRVRRAHHRGARLLQDHPA